MSWLVFYFTFTLPDHLAGSRQSPRTIIKSKDPRDTLCIAAEKKSSIYMAKQHTAAAPAAPLSRFGVLVAQLESIVASAVHKSPQPLLCFDLLSDLITAIDEDTKVSLSLSLSPSLSLSLYQPSIALLWICFFFFFARSFFRIISLVRYWLILKKLRWFTVCSSRNLDSFTFFFFSRIYISSRLSWDLEFRGMCICTCQFG